MALLYVDEYDRLAEQRRETHPFVYQAPYQPLTAATFAGIEGNYVWVPFKDRGYSLFLFDDAADRDAFAERFEEIEAAA